MNDRTLNIELLLSISHSLDIKYSNFKAKLFNYIVILLKLASEEGPKNVINFIGIQRRVSKDYYKQKYKGKDVALARQIAMTIIKNNLGVSLKNIGIIFGGRDHATVLHARKVIDNFIDTDKIFRLEYEFYLDKLHMVHKRYIN